MREDSRLVDQLFRNNSRSDKERIRQFVKNNVIDLSINYPRTPPTLPALVLLLKSESEAQAYIGDTMGYETPEEMGYDEEIEDVIGGTTTVGDTSGVGSIVYGPFYILSATNNTVRVTDRTFEVDDFVGKLYTLRIVGGTGAGQSRSVLANSHNFIMVDSNWTTNPDDTSILEVHKPEPELIGEPEKLYPRRDPYTFLERRGSLYTNNYTLQVMASSQEDTIYLYTIVKALMTLARLYLEGQGVINMRMSGSDFSNRPDYVPDQAYMRAMTLQFEAPFDVYETESDVATQFTMSLLDGSQDDLPEVASIDLDINTFTPTISGP